MLYTLRHSVSKRRIVLEGLSQASLSWSTRANAERARQQLEPHCGPLEVCLLPTRELDEALLDGRSTSGRRTT